MDISSTAQVATQALADAQASTPLPTKALAIGALIGPLLRAKIKASGLMDKVNPMVKPWVPTLISLGGGALVAISHGASWQDALMGALMASASSQVTHNMTPSDLTKP